MSETKRNLTEIKSETPGSGKYEYKTFIGEGPKYSMRPKYDKDGITEGKRSIKAYILILTKFFLNFNNIMPIITMWIVFVHL